MAKIMIQVARGRLSREIAGDVGIAEATRHPLRTGEREGPEKLFERNADSLASPGVYGPNGLTRGLIGTSYF